MPIPLEMIQKYYTEI